MLSSRCITPVLKPHMVGSFCRENPVLNSWHISLSYHLKVLFSQSHFSGMLFNPLS
jgi:hypothetical protein